MDRTVAVTGGSGFIGTHVVDALLDAGCAVRVLDPKPPHRADAEWVPVDVLDTNGLTEAVAGSEVIFHLAAIADVNDVIADPTLAIQVNTLGTARVLEAARLAEAGRVVLASTVWVYAATTGDEVDEDTLFDPNTDRHLYVTSKVAAEMACRDYHTLYGRPYTILRYGIPYGPRMRDNCVVAAFMKRCMRGEPLRIDGDGSQQRSFVYVEDLAQAHVKALDDVATNRTYNIEGAVPVSIREIAESVTSLIGAGVVEFGEPRPGDLKARTVSNARARVELGWEPTTSFADGLARTYAWYQAQAAAEASERAIAPPAGPQRGITPTVNVAIDRPGGTRRIAVVPAYNEEPTVAQVLDKLSYLVDELVVVDDGSTDGTRAAIQAWLPGHDHCRLLSFDENQGMSAAYYLAFTDLRRRMRAGELSPDDLVYTIDADGQHDLDVLDDLHRRTVDEKLDALLVRRDLSTYPVYKQAGNWVLSTWATLWAGARLDDVESGYRIFRLGAWPTRSRTTAATSTPRPSRSRWCCAASATACATTSSCRFRCTAAARACTTCSSISAPSPSPPCGSPPAGLPARTCRAWCRRSRSPPQEQ